MKYKYFIKASKIIVYTFLFLFIVTTMVLAGEGISGNEIISDLKNETAVTGSGMAIINLITENSNGQQKSSKLKIYRQDKNEIEKQLIEYLEPSDVEGTKFLSIKKSKTEDPKMWLYLPALGRERRIAGHRTKDNFMDTDFTFEEIGGSKDYSEEYRGKRFSDEKIHGYDCYVVRLIPRKEDSDYSKIKMWVWKEEMMPLKTEFYENTDQLSKVLELKELKKEENGDYQPGRVVMSSKLKGTRTIIEILKTSSKPVNSLYFSLKYLRRK